MGSITSHLNDRGATRGPHHAAALSAAVVAVMTGCATSPVHTPPTHTSAASTPTPAPTTAPATPTPFATVTLASCAAPVSRDALRVVHRFGVSPDDIAVDATGDLWVSARTANEAFHLRPDGTTISTVTVTGGPEGLAVAPSGVYVAQQNVNAIEQIEPQRHVVMTFPNHTTNAGIDGINIGTTSQTLLVPDSPNGTLIELSVAGAPSARVLASNLGRPVAATADPQGDIFVASESSPGLVEVTPSGTVLRLGAFTDLDEVVYYAGLLYVTELNRRDVVAVDPTSGATAVVAVNLPAPQGLAVTAGGILEIVDATTNTLYLLPTCGAA
jgi:sugar lactone lactonase YvrE